MKPLYLNGKFVAQRTTGVQRFAREVVIALDRSLQTKSCGGIIELLLPPSAKPIEGLKAIRQRHVGLASRPLILWEQLDLPANSRDGTLVCLSGSAPLFARKCIPTIHDAAVYLHPHSYSVFFVVWYRLLFWYHARRSLFILTVSKSSACDLAKYLPATMFRVIPNSAEHIINQPSDESVITRLQLLPKRYLLAVGSLNQTKNFAALAEAYAGSTLAERFPLVVVGAVNSDVFRSSGFKIDHPNILWTGSIPDPQLRALYEQAAIFIFPSIYEGFGIPPLEAMLCGCPVAASNISSIAEVCGDAARYFKPQHVNEIRSVIESIMANDSHRSVLVERGRERALSFTWDISAERLRLALAEFKLIDC